MLGMFTHDAHLQTLAETRLSSIRQSCEMEHLRRQARTSWRQQLARTLVAWASKLEPETRDMTTRAA